ncbi:MAG: hypothetical protein HY961_02980 [Ignavibacteriae bacterium]|nr:hypothetical protein [Ignavibacteriota bacterium]
MDNEDDYQGPQSRPPEIEDLVNLCRRLNEAGARYIVVGGMAIIQNGFLRATQDVDLLVDSSEDNFQRIRKGMLGLPDQAIREVEPGDIAKYVVVRVGDEILVDLMAKTCGIDYEEAKSHVVVVELDGVRIPVANMELLWRMKQTGRDKDIPDLLYLRERLNKNHLPPRSARHTWNPIRVLLKLLGK